MTAIDLTHRIIQPAPLAKTRFHAWRRTVQAACGLLIVLLPLTNGLRLDIRSGVFYFGWHRLAAHDSVFLFWVLMLGVWSLVATAFLYGRLWCGYLCPQTLVSDFADSLKGRLDRALHARRRGPERKLSDALWTLLVLGAALAASAIAVCYWVDPAAVLHAVAAPATDPGPATAVYGIAAVIAADMLWVRRKLCAGVCQYGALLGVLGDRNTLAVRFLEERKDDCIRCARCETVCPMEIDIKKGVGQIGCIGCGECVDACSDILGRRGTAGIIEYRYGTQPDRAMRSLTWPQRLGLWDSRRAAVVLTWIGCAVAVWAAGWGTFPSSLTIMANGAVTRDTAIVSDGYTLSIHNGAPRPVTYAVSVAEPMLRPEPSTITVDAHDNTMVPVALTQPSMVTKPGARIVTTLSLTHGTVHLSAPIVFVAPHS